jgi:hypothetical protein
MSKSHGNDTELLVLTKRAQEMSLKVREEKEKEDR